jgi:hypothetical protein
LTLGGVSVGATIGVSGADLVGTAYNLQDARDIEGSYSAAVAGGAEAVQFRMRAASCCACGGVKSGLKSPVAISGLTISFK